MIGRSSARTSMYSSMVMLVTSSGGGLARSRSRSMTSSGVRRRSEFLRGARQIAVVEAIANPSAEGLRPGGESFALALDQRIEGIEHDRLHAFERLALALRLRD